MESAKILICEDEFIIAYDLSNLLKAEGYDVVGSVDNGLDAVRIANEKKPDLILMDINLGTGMNGIEAASIIRESADIPLIFITAYSNRAVFDQAKSVLPNAYLVKPFTEQNLVAAIEMALYNFEHQKKVNSVEEQMERHKPAQNDYLIKNYFLIKTGNKLNTISFTDVQYLEAEGSYTEIYTDQMKFIISRNLQNILKLLPKESFIRTHRSFAVNSHYIDNIKEFSITIGNKSIPCSRSYRENLKQIKRGFY